MKEKAMILWLLSAIWEKYPHTREKSLVAFLEDLDCDPTDANIYKALQDYAEELEKSNPDN